MELTNLLFCIIGSVGMTHIVVEGEIFRPIREFVEKYTFNFLSKLINCYQCTGFWCGIILGLGFYTPTTLCTLELTRVFACGCASSCLSYFWAMFLTYLEANTTIKTHE
jgi:hypothetical protein